MDLLLRNSFAERELAVNNEIQMFRLASLMKRDPKTFYEVCDAMPFYMNINRIDTLDSTFVNLRLEHLMEVDREHIVEEGFELIRSISHKQTLSFAIDVIRNFEEESDHDAVCSYFQYMRFNNKWQWMLTYKMFLNKKLYLNMGHQLENFGGIGSVIKRVLGDTMIKQNGWLKFSSLSKREKEILKLLANGHSRKHISEALFISEHTVRTHRQKIMEKIDANSICDIIRFAQAFELIGQI